MTRMKLHVAQRHCERLGDEFVQALWNRSLSGVAIAVQFGMRHRDVVEIRTLMVPEEQRQIRARHMKNPEFLEALRSDAPTKEIAQRFGLDRSYINKYRIRVRGRQVREPLRLTASVIALLKSSLSNKDVAAALDLDASVITHHRKALGMYVPPKIRTTPEQRAIVIAASSIKEAERLTGIPYSTCRDIRTVAQGLPRRPVKKNVKNFTSMKR